MIGMCWKRHTSNTRVVMDMSMGLYMCGPCMQAKRAKEAKK